MSRDNKTLLRQGISALNEGNLEEYLGLYDANAVMHGVQGVEPGIDGIRRFYEGFLNAFPNARVIIDDILAEGDVVACRFTMTGTNEGEFMGMPATNRTITFEGITILKFAQGRCVERWNQADFLGMMSQLGALPPQG